MLISFYDHLAKLKQITADIVQIYKLRLVIDRLKFVAIIISLTIVACSSLNEDMVAPTGELPVNNPTQTTQIGPTPTSKILVTRPKPAPEGDDRATL
jgi:hypothetical protein